MTFGKARRFALCPVCENPVHLIRIYTTIGKIKPYAAHNKRDVKGIAPYSEAAYLTCPLAKHACKGVSRSSLKDNPNAQTIRREVVENLDYLLSIFEDATGIHIGYNAADKIMRTWTNARGYASLYATFYNLPFILFYGESMSLAKRWIVKDSKIDRALAVRKDLRREEITGGKYVRYSGKGGQYIELRFCLGSKKDSHSGEHWTETFYLDVNIGKKRGALLHQAIQVDHYALQRMKENKAHRNEKTLKIASKYL